MPSLAYSFIKNWQAHDKVDSVPQMSLDDFQQVLKQENQHYVADYHGVTLSSAMQPIYSIDHQRVIGYEALIRAHDEEQSAISPVELLNSPKKEADNIYLDRLCRYLHIANFQDDSADNNWLFINVSAQASAKGRNYGLFFGDLLKKYQIKPQNIVVEIIEDPTTDNEQLQAAADYYKSIGCLLAIDDFGAGHSNFERIWNLKPDIVKLDRSLLLHAVTSKHSLKMMSSIVDLLHQAGCLVVVEGVEDQQQALIAMDSGADFIQGFYFSKPQANTLANHDQTNVFQSLTRRFVDSQAEVVEQERNAIKLYCLMFKECVLSLQQGLPLTEACQHFSRLPRSIRCFLTDALGNQIDSTIEFEKRSAENDKNNDKFKQLKMSERANWFRKDYIQNALKNNHRIAISAPYRSITGDGLCITISMSFEMQGRKYILCFDVKPRDCFLKSSKR